MRKKYKQRMLISSTAWFVVITLIFGVAFSFGRGHAPNIDDMWPWIAAAVVAAAFTAVQVKRSSKEFSERQNLWGPDNS